MRWDIDSESLKVDCECWFLLKGLRPKKAEDWIEWALIELHSWWCVRQCLMSKQKELCYEGEFQIGVPFDAEKGEVFLRSPHWPWHRTGLWHRIGRCTGLDRYKTSHHPIVLHLLHYLPFPSVAQDAFSTGRSPPIPTSSTYKCKPSQNLPVFTPIQMKVKTSAGDTPYPAKFIV
jgi:hypothetical protein